MITQTVDPRCPKIKNKYVKIEEEDTRGQHIRHGPQEYFCRSDNTIVSICFQKISTMSCNTLKLHLRDP